MTTAQKSSKTDVAKKDEEAMDVENEAVLDDKQISLMKIDANIKALIKAVETQESRFSHRSLRKLNSERKMLSNEVLAEAINKHSSNDEVREELLAYINASNNGMSVENDASCSNMPVEVELYLHLLVTVFLMDSHQLEQAQEVVTTLVEKLDQLKRRSSHVLGSWVFFFYTRIHELQGTLSSTRMMLHKMLRKATLQNNEIGQAVLINGLLRSLIKDKLYDQADLLVGKAHFPEGVPNAHAARYQYYLGRIKAVQLDYSDALQHLTEASRKAPAGAYGFLQHTHKLMVIVQLLTGEIPELDIFKKTYLKTCLKPYFELTSAVRQGDLKTFNQVVATKAKTFLLDDTYKLIQRLRVSVIKAGIRKISLSYARISLADMAVKLSLDNAEEVEYVVAKAIRDGVIDAVLDHETSSMCSKEVVDVYSTGIPQEAFHQRIDFCLNIHRDCVKSMRYAANDYKRYLLKPEEIEAADAEAVIDVVDAEDDGLE